MPPVGSVWRPGDIGVVIGGVFSAGGFRAADEVGVHGFQEEFRHFHGGTDDDVNGTKFEEHDLAVVLSEFMDGTVGEWTDEVEVSDYRPWFGAGR